MKVSEIKTLLDAEVVTGEDLLDMEVISACGCDMMSDVLAFVKDQAVLLTGLMNTQVVRTAELMDMRCIVFVRGKEPDEGIIALAKSKNLVVMTSKHRMYTACGILYANGLHGTGVDKV